MAITEISLRDTVEEWRQKSNSIFADFGDSGTADIDYWDTDLITSLNQVYSELDAHGHFSLYADPSTEEVLRLDEIVEDKALAVDSIRNLIAYGNNIDLDGKASTSGASRVRVTSANGTPSIQTQHSGGTIGSETATTSTNTILSLIGNGYDTVSYNPGGQIDFVATETWTASARGTEISFKTVANAGSTLVQRMLLNSLGATIYGMVEASGDIKGSTFTRGSQTIDEFSTDGTMAGNSDTALPTEKATKAYMDAHAALTNNPHTVTHSQLSDKGTYDHAAIDTHIDNATLHRIINDSGTSTTELWSASKIQTELNDRTQAQTADITFYVSVNGSDSNDGLTIGNAFLTLQKAVDEISVLHFKTDKNATIYVEGNVSDIFPVTSLVTISNISPIITFLPYGTTDTIQCTDTSFMSIYNSTVYMDGLAVVDNSTSGNYTGFSVDNGYFKFIGEELTPGASSNIGSWGTGVYGIHSIIILQDVAVDEYEYYGINIFHTYLEYTNPGTWDGIMDTDNADATCVGISINSGSYAFLSDLSKSTSAVANPDIMISVNRSSHCEIENSSFITTESIGIWINFSSYADLNNVSMTYPGTYGLYLDNRSTGRARNGCVFNYSGSDGIRIVNNSSLEIYNLCQVRYNSVNGITLYNGAYLHSSASTVSVHLNVVENDGIGISAYYGSVVTLEYAYIYNNGGTYSVYGNQSSLRFRGEGDGGNNGKIANDNNTSANSLVYGTRGTYISLYYVSVVNTSSGGTRIIGAYYGTNIDITACVVSNSIAALYNAYYNSTITTYNTTGATGPISPTPNYNASSTLWNQDGAYWGNWGSRIDII